MSRLTRAALVAAGLVAVVVLFIVFRPGGNDDEESATTAATTTTTTGTEGTTTTTTVAPAAAVVAIAVRNGRIAGGPKVHRVAQGARVVVIVRADVEDEVHLHGYDLMQDVAPGSPARIRFRADVPGRFEMELENRTFPLGELEVRP